MSTVKPLTRVILQPSRKLKVFVIRFLGYSFISSRDNDKGDLH